MQSALKQSSDPATKVEFLSRKEFPDGFVLGTTAAAFQYEGEPDSRGVCIWDTFLKEKFPELVEEDKALEAVHHIKRYKEDVSILKHIGFDVFNFSISWPRILPNGRRIKGPNGEELGVNEDGIAYYNDLINELIKNGIEPMVCIMHWDLPQTLETEYLGFLDIKVVDDYRDYADLCFREFGDRVKRWITFNEPWSYSITGYLTGYGAPGRQVCPYKEIYIVTHNQLLAHAAAVKLYRENYKKSQNGEIGIEVNSMWTVPYTDTQEDKDAAIRAIEFMLGWVIDPLIFGDYPKSMRTLVGERLPKFTEIQANDVKDSFDFIALNYYTANYAANFPPPSSGTIYNEDSQVVCYTEKDGKPIGDQQGASGWIYSYPEGLKELLLYIASKYNNPPIYITENGIDELNDENLSFWEAFYDYPRITYHYKHLLAMKEAICKGANVKGYFAWSLLDNLDWARGFGTRYGINYVDFKNDYERHPKFSAGWFKFLLQK